MPRPRITHCTHGHRYTPENTYMRARKYTSLRTGIVKIYRIRNCRTCGLDSIDRYKSKGKAA